MNLLGQESSSGSAAGSSPESPSRRPGSTPGSPLQLGRGCAERAVSDADSPLDEGTDLRRVRSDGSSSSATRGSHGGSLPLQRAVGAARSGAAAPCTDRTADRPRSASGSSGRPRLGITQSEPNLATARSWVGTTRQKHPVCVGGGVRLWVWVVVTVTMRSCGLAGYRSVVACGGGSAGLS